MRVAKVITVTAEERASLTKGACGRSTPARLVLRAKIVLAAAVGRRNDEIAADLGCTRRAEPGGTGLLRIGWRGSNRMPRAVVGHRLSGSRKRRT